MIARRLATGIFSKAFRSWATPVGFLRGSFGPSLAPLAPHFQAQSFFL